MPYMHVYRNGQIYNHKRGADGQPEGRALGVFNAETEVEKAKAQLRVLEAAHRREMKARTQFASIDFRPTDAMAQAATQALLQEGGKATDRELAEQIKARQPLTLRSVRVIANKPNSEDIAYLLRGGDAGAAWAQAVMDEIARLEVPGAAVKAITEVPASVVETLVRLAMETGRFDDGEVFEFVRRTANDLHYPGDTLDADAIDALIRQLDAPDTKTLNTSNAGSVGFGVGEERTATAKYKAKDVVRLKAANLKGIVVNVAPTDRPGKFLYTVATVDGGQAVCTAGDLERAGARGIKDVNTEGALALVLMARTLIREDRPQTRRAAYKQLSKAYQMLAGATSQHEREAAGYLRQMINWPRKAFNPDIFPVRWWIKGINKIHRRLVREQIDTGDYEETPAPGVPADAAKQSRDIPIPTPAEAIKAVVDLADDYAQRWKQKSPDSDTLERAQEALYAPADFVRAYVERGGDQNALKALADFETTLYTESMDSPAQWYEAVTEGANALKAFLVPEVEPKT